MKFSFKNKTVLITGAASGIGKIMTRKVLEKGANELVLLDYNFEGLQNVSKEYEHFGKSLQLYQVDLSNQQNVLDTIEKIKTDINQIDVVINNAGIVVGKNFVDHTVDDITRTMQINSTTLMLIAQAFLPKMMENNLGAICNIASMAGLTAIPRMSIYNASKWAVVGWTEALYQEMKQAKKDVVINCVMPFYINTGMFDGVKSRVVPILDPEKVSTKILTNIEKGKLRTPMPLPYWFIRLSQGLLPNRLYDFVMGDLMGVYDSMEDFKGRK